MTHLTEDQLAGQALDLAETLSAEQSEHLAGCATCRDELATLRAVVALGRDPQTAQVRLPYRADLWDRIQTELASDDSPARPLPPVADPGPTEGRRTGRPRRGLLLLAAAVGLLVGAAGVLGLERLLDPRSPAPGQTATVIAQTALTALPGHSGSGTAELVEAPSTPELRVRLEGAAADTSAFHEVWLLNADGRRMYALGVLPSSGSASYPLPPALAGGLAGYTTVDVSVEPYDGNAAHSANSVVRGVLPG